MLSLLLLQAGRHTPSLTLLCLHCTGTWVLSFDLNFWQVLSLWQPAEHLFSSLNACLTTSLLSALVLGYQTGCQSPRARLQLGYSNMWMWTQSQPWVVHKGICSPFISEPRLLLGKAPVWWISYSTVGFMLFIKTDLAKELLQVTLCKTSPCTKTSWTTMETSYQ